MTNGVIARQGTKGVEAISGLTSFLRGAILMAISNSFKVSFRLACTREKAEKIKLSLSPILD
jgi:hypothetical protein